jgi:hypothetical protein
MINRKVSCIYPNKESKQCVIHFYHSFNDKPQFDKTFSIIACSNVWDKGYYSVSVNKKTAQLFFDTINSNSNAYFIYNAKHDQTVNQFKFKDLMFSFYYIKKSQLFTKHDFVQSTSISTIKQYFNTILISFILLFVIIFLIFFT